MIGQELGNYKFISILGEGGMAIVYLAENTMLSDLVAIKMLKNDFVNNKNIRMRFLDEAKKMVKVKHPNIIQVYDLIDAGDIVAIVMEYVKGQSLKDLISKKGKINQADIEYLFPQLLLSLEHVHKAGFIHRDIKPSNFMLSSNGVIKLTDFGIAKDKNSAIYTETGLQMGTPMYMSPEQIRSTKDVDHKSDIYSLGVVLYEMIVGSFPFDKRNLSLPEIQVCILNEPVPLTYTLFDAQIAKATAKNTENRYINCGIWRDEFLKEKEKAPRFINHSIEIKEKSKMSNYAIAASAVWVIAVIYFFIFRDGEVPPPPVEGNNTKTTEYTQQELKEKSVAEMDEIKARSENENLKCRGCDKVTIGKYDYNIKINENDVITEITKSDAPKVVITKPVVVKKPVKETAEYKKKREAREAEAKRIEDEKKAGNPKTVSYRAKQGDVYSTIAQYGTKKCGKKVRMGDWSPKIANAADVKYGRTYTCTCPK
jgi:serine/threonine protein kinase